MKDRALGLATAVVLSFFSGACSTDTFTANDSGGDDSGTDASVPADSSVLDAVAIDAQDEAEASAPFSCSTPPLGTLFCDDFDTLPTVSSGFTGEIAFNGGLVSFDLASYTSSPHGARVEIPMSTTTASAAAALLFQDPAAKYKTATLRAATRVHVIDDSQGIPFLVFSYSSNVANGSVVVSIGAQNKRLAIAYSEAAIDGGVIGSAVDLGPYVLDQWYALTLVVATGSPAQLTAYVNADKTTFPAALSAPKDLTRNFQMGIDGQSGTDIVVDFDDFSCGGL